MTHLLLIRLTLVCQATLAVAATPTVNRPHRTVQERLQDKISRHSLFLLDTNKEILGTDTNEEDSSFLRSLSSKSKNWSWNPKWNVTHGKVIHELALEASHEFQRYHGHHVVLRDEVTSAGIPRVGESACDRASSSAVVYLPTRYGADPTGTVDSTSAFQNMMWDVLAGSTSDTNKKRRPRPMADGIVNLGGATIDLEGGQYLISQPLEIPHMFGNAHIQDGSLIASALFPKDKWMIELGNAAACHPYTPDGKPDQQKCCNEFLSVSNVLLYANLTAAGGIRLGRVMGATLTSIFVTGFVHVGILVQEGHEAMISDSWLAACYWSDAAPCKEQQKQLGSASVGIRLDGMDHYITNTIVFDYARFGVQILQPANLLVGVHTWNGGGQGIVIGNSTSSPNSVRLIACYLDFATLDIWDPSSIVVESTFFYYAHAVLHAGRGRSVEGLTMRFNRYSTNQSVVLEGTFDAVSQVSIHDEVNAVLSTQASRAIYQEASTEWIFDFGSVLLSKTVV